MVRIGLDVGGTFTDFTLLDETSGTVRYHKVPSTPEDPAAAISTGLSELLALHDVDPSEVRFLGHGTTVATNMVVERRGSRTGLITTRGFRDVLEIGRQTRPNLYDYSQLNPSPLVPRKRRHEVAERVNADGMVAAALNEADVEAAATALATKNVGSIAVCLLHSYQHAEHEHAVRAIIERYLPDVFISLSSEVLPEFREFERWSTTVINAFVGPRMAQYCERLAKDVRELGIGTEPLTFHSGGGLVSLATVRRFPVRTCLSGPAAGVAGAARLAGESGFTDIVTFDVGGTSTDVSLVTDATPQLTSQRLVAGYPVKTPMLDIHVIGAGGGSVAWIDPMGALKVGPHSAGARPGPVAYGTGGTSPTLTDANLCLGRLGANALLAGRVTLDAAASKRAIDDSIARPLGLSTEEAADGILQVAVANMSRAIRSVSTMRGHDLSQFALMAFGGAGPLHAAEIALECGIPQIIIPAEPGTMCARGMLLSDVSLDFVQTIIKVAEEETWQHVRELFQQMAQDGEQWLDREGIEEDRRRLHYAVDARYVGQNHEVRVALDATSKNGVAGFLDVFASVHRREYGHDIENRSVEIVNCRLQAVGLVRKAPLHGARIDGPLEAAIFAHRDVYFGARHGWIKSDIYARDRLPSGSTVRGPAIIEEMSSTAVIPPGLVARLDALDNIIVESGQV